MHFLPLLTLLTTTTLAQFNDPTKYHCVNVGVVEGNNKPCVDGYTYTYSGTLKPECKKRMPNRAASDTCGKRFDARGSCSFGCWNDVNSGVKCCTGEAS